VKRLFWIVVGAGLAVTVARRSRVLAERYLPPGTTDALGLVGTVAAAMRTARSEFVVGIAEREDQLRHDLVGDVDVEALRADRDRRRAATSRADDTRGRARRTGRDWASEPTDDPDDDDGDLPYSF